MHILKTNRRAAALGSLLLSLVLLSPRSGVASDAIVFRDIPSQGRQFMRWNETITLNAQQEAVRKAALTHISAPCCNDKTAYTCCCTCNQARAIWGLSKYMIAKQGASEQAVFAKVKEWIQFTHPNGFSGSACYTGRCNRPVRQDGCGGMNSDNPIF